MAHRTKSPRQDLGRWIGLRRLQIDEFVTGIQPAIEPRKWVPESGNAKLAVIKDLLRKDREAVDDSFVEFDRRGRHQR